MYGSTPCALRVCFCICVLTKSKGREKAEAKKPATAEAEKTRLLPSRPGMKQKSFVEGAPQVSLYKILFRFKALIWESIILLLPPPPHFAKPTLLQYYSC